jgi:hypothetical protein
MKEVEVKLKKVEPEFEFTIKESGTSLYNLFYIIETLPVHHWQRH